MSDSREWGEDESGEEESGEEVWGGEWGDTNHREQVIREITAKVCDRDEGHSARNAWLEFLIPFARDFPPELLRELFLSDDPFLHRTAVTLAIEMIKELRIAEEASLPTRTVEIILEGMMEVGDYRAIPSLMHYQEHLRARAIGGRIWILTAGALAACGNRKGMQCLLKELEDPWNDNSRLVREILQTILTKNVDDLKGPFHQDDLLACMAITDKTIMAGKEVDAMLDAIDWNIDCSRIHELARECLPKLPWIYECVRSCHAYMWDFGEMRGEAFGFYSGDYYYVSGDRVRDRANVSGFFCEDTSWVLDPLSEIPKTPSATKYFPGEDFRRLSGKEIEHILDTVHWLPARTRDSLENALEHNRRFAESSSTPEGPPRSGSARDGA